MKLGRGLFDLMSKSHRKCTSCRHSPFLFTTVPAVLGLILGGYAENNLRLALRIGRGDWSILLENTTSKVLVAMVLVVILGPIVKRRLLTKRAGR